jgi:carboxymethylenebutenolidase
MCHPDSAQAPGAPIRGAVAEHGELTLRSDDGNEFAAYAARSAEMPERGLAKRGVVILPDVRGLFQFYKDLAVRFAEVGIDAVAFDYYGRRDAGADRSESFAWQEHSWSTTADMVARDVRACLDHLRSPKGGGAQATYTVGFCWGGAASWRQSAEDQGVNGAIGFYGYQPMSRVAQWIPKMKAPLLMLLAGADPPAEYERFAQEARRGGVEVESYTYPGAPHSFFDRSSAENAEYCDDAWRRMLDFTARHAARPATAPGGTARNEAGASR